MANEARVTSSLAITNGSQRYTSQPTSFSADVSATGGPSPGSLSVATTGTDVSFSQIIRPGLCRIQNLDPTHYVEWGVHDGALFHPVGEILPGESYIFRLSRNVGEEEDVPGTGTTAVVNTFFLRANGAACKVLVEAFER